jgi:hypothetical protein
MSQIVLEVPDESLLALKLLPQALGEEWRLVVALGRHTSSVPTLR